MNMFSKAAIIIALSLATSPLVAVAVQINGQLVKAGMERLASDPVTGLFEGRMYWNTTSDRPKAYNGSSWQFTDLPAALTASRALASSAGGIPVAATTTSTELGYVNGVTSAIQTQIDAKLTRTLTSAQVFVGNGSNVATGVALTGDVTVNNAGVTAVGTNKVTNAMAAQMAAHTIKGNNTGSTANAADLTVTQVTAELNAFVGDSGAGGTKGLVPAPASGDAAANKVLKADGTWAAQATAGYAFVGSAYIAGTTNCDWTTASSAIGSLGTDTDCPGPTIEFNPGSNGTISTTDTDKAQFSVTSLVAGTFKVTISGYLYNTTADVWGFAISDGTTTSGRTGFNGASANAGGSINLVGFFTYASSGTRTFELHGGTGSGTLHISNGNSTYQRLNFSIEKVAN